MADLIIALAEIIIVISYLFTDILILRIFTVIGMAIYIIGGVTAGFHTEGMKAVILFSTLCCLVNIVQSTRIIFERIPIFLPDEVKSIYNNFQNMTPNEFMNIYKLSHVKKLSKGDKLTQQNQIVPDLIMIKSGVVNILRDHITVSKLGYGFFVGEMSLLTKELATATVEVESNEVECLIWSKTDLHWLENKNPKLYEKLKDSIAINLIKKINYKSFELLQN